MSQLCEKGETYKDKRREGVPVCVIYYDEEAVVIITLTVFYSIGLICKSVIEVPGVKSRIH